MSINADSKRFRVHEKLMSDGSSIYVPEIGFLKTDGNHVWVRLSIMDYTSMDEAVLVIENTKSRIHHVDDVYHYLN